MRAALVCVESAVSRVRSCKCTLHFGNITPVHAGVGGVLYVSFRNATRGSKGERKDLFYPHLVSHYVADAFPSLNECMMFGLGIESNSVLQSFHV